MAAKILADEGITKIIASPLSRALETARIVGAAAGSEPVVDGRLIERNFGLFEGMTIDEVHQHREEMREHMNPQADVDGKHYPWDAEPLPEVIDRVYTCINEHKASGGKCLFVFHGIPFRAVTRKFLNDMYSSPNAAPVRFEADGDNWRMVPLDPDNAPIQQIYNAQTTMGRI